MPNPLVQPFLKWPGGKRQLLAAMRRHLPARFKHYYEPFLGGGALLFALQPDHAVVNDANGELINLYQVIKADPAGLLAEIGKHSNREAYFYALRAQDRQPHFASLTAVARAARILFLNKTCYNGLFRVNRQGQFNAPFGHYANPVLADAGVIYAVSDYLNHAHITLRHGDFEPAVTQASAGDLVYFDPPYDPISETSAFTGYHASGFGKEEQQRLKQSCDALTKRQCAIVQSNAATDFIRTLYCDPTYYQLVEVTANRNINAKGTGRGKVKELLIVNRWAAS